MAILISRQQILRNSDCDLTLILNKDFFYFKVIFDVGDRLTFCSVQKGAQ